MLGIYCGKSSPTGDWPRLVLKLDRAYPIVEGKRGLGWAVLVPGRRLDLVVEV